MTENFYKSIYDFGKLVEEMTTGTEFSKFDRTMFELETGMFFMFLIGSSKFVTEDDTKLLNEYLSKNWTIEEYQNAVDTDTVYITRYMEKMPLSFEMLVAFDQVAGKVNEVNGSSNLSGRFIDLYRFIGNELVSTENKPHNEDKKNLAIYIKDLEEYRIEHLM